MILTWNHLGSDVPQSLQVQEGLDQNHLLTPCAHPAQPALPCRVSAASKGTHPTALSSLASGVAAQPCRLKRLSAVFTPYPSPTPPPPFWRLLSCPWLGLLPHHTHVHTCAVHTAPWSGGSASLSTPCSRLSPAYPRRRLAGSISRGWPGMAVSGRSLGGEAFSEDCVNVLKIEKYTLQPSTPPL